jgi:hypothetical protein
LRELPPWRFLARKRLGDASAVTVQAPSASTSCEDQTSGHD